MKLEVRIMNWVWLKTEAGSQNSEVRRNQARGRQGTRSKSHGTSVFCGCEAIWKNKTKASLRREIRNSKLEIRNKGIWQSKIWKNKANLANARINVTILHGKAYGEIPRLWLRKNKANSKPKAWIPAFAGMTASGCRSTAPGRKWAQTCKINPISV